MVEGLIAILGSLDLVYGRIQGYSSIRGVVISWVHGGTVGPRVARTFGAMGGRRRRDRTPCDT